MGRRIAALACACAAVAGCGGSSKPESGAATPTSATTAPATAPTVAPAKPFVATLTADGHRPKVGEKWTFVVKARNADGTPVQGTVRAQVLLGGVVIDTIGWFGFDGKLERSYTWSTDKRAQQLTFRAGVVANGGTKNLDYPINVR